MTPVVGDMYIWGILNGNLGQGIFTITDVDDVMVLYLWKAYGDSSMKSGHIPLSDFERTSNVEGYWRLVARVPQVDEGQ